MKLSRKQLRRIVSEAMGFGRDPLEPTGKIIVIRKQDPRYTAYIGYEIKGVIRNLIKASESEIIDQDFFGKKSDRVIETLDLNSLRPALTHNYVRSNRTIFDTDLQKYNDRGMMRDIYDPHISMMFKPWMTANNRANEKYFIYDLVNAKIKELGYLGMDRDTFEKLSIQYLNQDVSLEPTGKVHKTTRAKQFKSVDAGRVEGQGTIGFKPEFN